MASNNYGGLQRPTKVLIVDDHPLVRRGMTQLINDEPDLQVCGDAEDAATAMAQVESKRPDLVVVDISLKAGHGIELIKEIKTFDERIKMLVSSMHDEALYAERALRAGASGYINKQETPENVVAAIRVVLDGRVYLSPRMTHHMLHRVVDPGTSEQLPVDALSDRELEVFEMIGHGKTTRGIADSLDLSVKTVETYRENIKNKFNLKNSSELTCYAVRWVVEERSG
jgi:DNA-binding NarL/FixJ family response regulator